MTRMIKVRAEENALLVWNANHARTAYISGEELIALDEWTRGRESGFSDRLKKLGIIHDEAKPAIKNAIEDAVNRKSPPYSFCAPESLHVELTSQCPLNCPQCYKTRSKAKLSFDFLLDVINQADKMNVFQIALGGGEPLVYPHLLAVIEEISNRGMGSSVTTSGFSLDQSLLTKLQKAGLNHLQISLNGSSHRIHSRSREGFEYAMGALKLLNESEISFGVNWVARMDNIDDFPRFAETAKEYHSRNINILRCKPSFKEKFTDLDLTSEKLEFLEKTIRSTKGIDIKLDSAFSNLLCHLNDRAGFFSGCGAGRRFLALDADGYYRPCSHVNIKERGKNLAAVWIHSPNLSMFRSIPQRITEPCKTCEYLSGCFGCRSIVLAQELDFFSGDRTCLFAKNQSCCERSCGGKRN